MLVLLLGVSVWFVASKRASQIYEAVSNNLLLVSLVIWFSGAVLYLIGFYNAQLNWVAVAPRVIIASFKMFVAINELARVPKELQENAIYMSAFSLVHFAAAFVTFMFVFKMVGYKIKSALNIMIYKKRYAKEKDVHLFWGVNEASCLLAEDIKLNFADDTIIFVDVDKENVDNTQKKANLSYITNTITITNSEIARLDAINALVDHCYNGPAEISGNDEVDVFGILHLKNIRAIVEQSNKVCFYFLSDDETQNIAGALNLQQDKTLSLKGKDDVTIYVHARRDANNEVFDHYSQYDDTQRIKIKLVDSAYLSITRLKEKDKTLPVNCVEFDKATGLVKSPFTALVIGFGGTGQEAFKFLYEYATFVGENKKKSPFKCYAIDEKMGKIAGVIKEKMPAIGEEELEMIQTSVDSDLFWGKIKSIICDLNYVVIALNNDALGLSLAVNLFKYALKYRLEGPSKLKIMVRCYDSSNEKRMTEVVNNLNNSIDGDNLEMVLYGQEKELYRCSTILSDDTLTEAKEFNRIYENSPSSADNQWKKNFGNDEIANIMDNKKISRYHAIYDINRRVAQNISNSLHNKTKLILMGLNDSDCVERLKHYYDIVTSREQKTINYTRATEAEAELLWNIANVEHERWIASHKLMGYTYNAQNDVVRKFHKNICPLEELDEMTQSYDCNVVDTTIKMEYEKMIKNIKK
jgi:hypothetical protein